MITILWRRACRTLLLAALLQPVNVASADLRLPALISDHMVVQRGKPVVIWGWSNPGTSIGVALAGNRAATRAEPDGTWRAVLPALEGEGPYEIVIQSGDSKVTVKDVLAGEVRVGSGQSNMQWPVAKSARAAEEIAAANHSRLRMFTVGTTALEKPATDLYGAWQVASPETTSGLPTCIGGCSRP